MNMNKNLVILALSVLLVIGSIWGSVANKKKAALNHELETKVTELETVKQQTSQNQEMVIGKTADLQEALQAKEQQLSKSRKELISLRKSAKALEAQVSERDAAIAKLQQARAKMQAQLKTAAKKSGAQAGEEVKALQDQLAQQAETLAAKESDLQKTTAELSELQEQYKTLEDQLSAAGEESVKAEEVLAAEQTIAQLQEQLAGGKEETERVVSQLARSLELSKAQIVGLEKIVEEKNDALEETSSVIDRLKVNMDVLLAKVSDQQDGVQELQEENRELIKELALKNEEIADLEEQLIQTPVQE
jgi:chromosome segregation ATPase